ncbi:hypothetical protein NE237_016102 [Protea cynaroides]|uniref:UspA domain-containing protein n=1 Tax=Protea cynaroides TaxID=273540 RepID=A0A9Q0KF87_9MAGN|nr:hypothetical protein NE237_016102 [Protea cynaroides]
MHLSSLQDTGIEMANNTQGEQEGSRDDVSIEIAEANESLASTIRVKMEHKSPSLCIYRVPEKLLMVSKKSYIPELVSIGPYHHGNSSLGPMEDHKWPYLHALLGRNPMLEKSLDECVKAIRELENRARKCYSESENITFTSDQFVEMMLVDGCFIIELFLKFLFKGLRRKGDPVFNNKWMIFLIRRDLMLLENQIPLFVLQRLYDLVPIPNQFRQSLSELAFRFFKAIIPGNKEALEKKFVHDGGHLLDLLRQCYLSSFPRVTPSTNHQRGSREHLHSATKLQKSGVKIKKSVHESLLDLKFDKGELRIPPLKIYDYTDSILRNLIALEQCCPDYTKQISSYALLMENLIQSNKDVRLLQQKGIIVNHLDAEEDILSIFNNLCKEVEVEDHYYVGLCQQVKAYCNTNLHGQWSKLRREMNPYLLQILVIILFFSFTVPRFSPLVLPFNSSRRSRFHHHRNQRKQEGEGEEQIEMEGDRRVGVALDFSPCSKKALKWVVDNVVRDGDHLILINVQPEGYYEGGEMQLWEVTGSPLIPLSEFSDSVIMKKYGLKPDAETMDILNTVARQKEIVVVAKVFWGDPRMKICEAIDNIPLSYLIMGSRGLGTVKRVLMGSVSSYVVNAAACPVTVVKISDHEA